MSEDLFTSFPDNDDEFEDVLVTDIRLDNDFFVIRRADGWDFGFNAHAPVPVKTGMVARFYGKGVGFPVYGLFLDGVQVFYIPHGQR